MVREDLRVLRRLEDDSVLRVLDSIDFKDFEVVP